jgi:hypothetical protein
MLLINLLVWMTIASPHPVASQAASQNAVKKWPDAHARRLIKRILSFNGDAILLAGSSGDRRYLPYLQKVRNSREGDTAFVAPELTLALAKLGDKSELQTVFCHLHDNSIFSMEKTANRELPYIGGWFAVQSYLEFATEDDEYNRKWSESSKGTGSDLVPRPGFPTYWVAQDLPKVVTNAPFPPLEKPSYPPPNELPRRIQAWRKWIAAHKGRLNKLKPTGDGVDFSAKACENFDNRQDGSR